MLKFMLMQKLNFTTHNSAILSIGEQGGWLPLLKKKFMTPSNTQNGPPPPQKWLLTPYPDFELFKLVTGFFFKFFFSKKKSGKKNFAGSRRHQFWA